MVSDASRIWIGMEYFCNVTGDFWNKGDDQIILTAVRELIKLRMIDGEADVLDTRLVRMPKAYPAYFGSYANFDAIRKFTDSFENLFLIGRNGMHRYNNQDHSMLAAMTAVENIVNGIKTKDNLWDVNTEEVYQEM